MVRHEAKAQLNPQGQGGAAACCACPAGESPVPVGVGAPGSRPQVVEGDLLTRAGCQKFVNRREPLSGEQARGPQHEVKPAASTELQPAGRAAHVTAKATSPGRDPKRAGDCGGVWGAARVQGHVRNVRGPSVQPLSGQAGSYKPKAKSSAAQRESEGIVVPDDEVQAPSTKAVGHNAAGGKGPCGGQADGAGKREGMAGKTGPNDPDAGDCGDKVRQLQRQLWAAAKRAPGRRFHALYDQMCRGDVLHEAWKRVRRNKGAAGVDRMTIGEVEQYGVRRFLQELGEVLRAGEYGAQVVRRAYIPKADGAKRPLGIPTVARPGGADGGQAGAGADLRGGLRAELVRVPAQAQCAAGAGEAQASGQPRRRSRAGTPTSRTTSAASSTTSCSPWWRSGSATAGCSSWCASGCRPG